MNYLERSTGYSPFVTNIIWFTGITEEELKTLLSTDYGIMPSNVLASSFSVQTLLQRLVWQRQPKLFRGSYHFDCGINMLSIDDLAKVFRKFSVAKAGMGALTRKNRF